MLKAEKTGNDDFTKRITEYCEKFVSLKKLDNISRHNVLKEIQNVLASSEDFSIKKDSLTSLLESVTLSLISVLDDESEKCREISVNVLKDICQLSFFGEKTLSLLLTTISNRLGNTEKKEPSEEVRLMEINLLYCFIEHFNGDFLPYLNDISTTLSNCIVDTCPEVKRRSCECLPLLSSKGNSHFHMVAKNFLKPLLCTISHQHLKTRAFCLKALGVIVDYLNNEEFEQAILHLAQRLFDRSPVVRMAATEVLGEMLVSLKDRYSYFQRLIPLMLSCLYDEVQVVRSKAEEFWIKAGNQYLQENEKDYKNITDFPNPDPVNYPVEGRPTLGCRTLVQRHVFNILPPLVHDLTDWAPETRLKSSKVLYSLILHSESKITIQLPCALEGVMSAAKDDEKSVVEQSTKSAELLGYFIDSDFLCDSILSLMHKSPTAEHLNVLAATIRGHPGTLSTECFKSICRFLANPAVCRLRKDHEQCHLLLCIECLLSSGNEISRDVSYDLFTILVSVSGLTGCDEIASKVDDLLQCLAELQSSPKSLLFKHHVSLLVKNLSEHNELWTPQSPELPIFSFVVASGFADDVIELAIPVLINNLHPSKDAKLRSKILALLVPVFKRLPISLYQVLSEKILDLIEIGIFPNLTWSAGRTASSLRTVAAASLFEIMSNSSLRKEMVRSLGEKLLPIITTLIEDEEASTRLLGCKVLEIVLPALYGSVDDLKMHKMCFELLHCMDDVSDDIRWITLIVLRAYIRSFPKDYDWKSYRSHLKLMFENVLIHMDDNNERIRMGVFDLLKEVAFSAPDVLLEEIESKRYTMSSSDLCDNLAEHIKSIKL